MIYTCGFYDDYGYKTLILNRTGLLSNKPVVVAAMGTFSSGALSHKSAKKKLFINVCKVLGLFKKIKWSVTSDLELVDVKKNVNKNAECIIAEDLPRTRVPGLGAKKVCGNVLKIAFLSRISPQKNLLGAIKSLKNLGVEVEFTIYGPEEDKDYWRKCSQELEHLPPNIHWSYEGDVPSEMVQEKLGNHDVLLFPTLGENYGHVIFEALSVGCIPVISDQTPWRTVADRQAGYVLPLTDDMATFTNALNELYKMDAECRHQMALRAVQIAEDKVAQSREETGYRIIFG